MNTTSRICAGALILAGLGVSSPGNAASIIIEKTDTRAMSDLQCSLEFNYNNNNYYDWQNVGGVFPSSTEIRWGVSVQNPSHVWSCTGGQCRGDGVYAEAQYNTSGQRLIIAKEDDPNCYQDPFPSDSGHNIRVQCWFSINGAPHYDWEDFSSSEMPWCGGNDIRLILNGCNGSWNGSQWVGDFLRHNNGDPGPSTC